MAEHQMLQRQVRRVSRSRTTAAETKQEAAMKEEVREIKMEQAALVLEKINEFDLEIARLTERRAERAKQLEAMLTELDTGVQVDGVTAEIKEVFGKAVRTVDPLELFNKVKNRTDFFDMVKVSITEAKQYFGDKEIERMGVTVPGASKGKQLVITAAKKRR